MTKYNALKEIEVKSLTCYYFDDIVNINDLDIDNILLHENILIYYVVYKSPYGENH